MTLCFTELVSHVNIRNLYQYSTVNSSMYINYLMIWYIAHDCMFLIFNCQHFQCEITKKYRIKQIWTVSNVELYAIQGSLWICIEINYFHSIWLNTRRLVLVNQVLKQYAEYFHCFKLYSKSGSWRDFMLCGMTTSHPGRSIFTYRRDVSVEKDKKHFTFARNEETSTSSGNY